MDRSLASDSASISIGSKPQSITELRARHLSNVDFVIYMLVAASGTHTFLEMANHPQRTDATNIFQFLIAYVLFGLPQLYMQISLGQYTQVGLILYKHLVPIGHGISYTYVILLLLKLIDTGTALSRFFVFFLTIFRKRMDWLICPQEYAEECWVYDVNCTKNCLASRNLSAYIYYKKRILGDSIENIEDSYISVKIRGLLPMGIIWGFTIVCLAYATSNYKKLIRVLLYITLSILFVLFCTTLVAKGGFYFVDVIYKIDSGSFLSLTTWSRAITGSIALLAIGRAFPTVYGSALAPTAHSGILSVVVAFLNMLMAMICTIFTFGCYGIIKESTYSDNRYIINLLYDDDLVLYALIPQAVSSLGVQQLWAALNFVLFIVLTLNCQLICSLTIDKCLSDMFPKLLKYRKYVLAFICFIGFFFGSIFISDGMMVVYPLIVTAFDAVRILCTVLVTVLVSWVYGVQRMCDDIHYVCGSPPAKFWKMLWYILPTLLIVVFVQYVRYLLTYLNFMEEVVFVACFLLITSPIYIFGVIELLRYIKKGNLLGLFKPTEHYGPPDEEERRLRRIQNPRTEIRCRRRTDKCTHRCLLGNTNLRAFVNQSSDGVIGEYLTATPTRAVDDHTETDTKEISLVS